MKCNQPAVLADRQDIIPKQCECFVISMPTDSRRDGERNAIQLQCG